MWWTEIDADGNRMYRMDTVVFPTDARFPPESLMFVIREEPGKIVCENYQDDVLVWRKEGSGTIEGQLALHDKVILESPDIVPQVIFVAARGAY